MGINTDTPTHSLTVIGDLSASANAFFGGDVQIAGNLIGGSPLKISGSIQIVNGQQGNEVIATLGEVSEDGSSTLSAS